MDVVQSKHFIEFFDHGESLQGYPEIEKKLEFVNTGPRIQEMDEGAVVPCESKVLIITAEIFLQLNAQVTEIHQNLESCKPLKDRIETLKMRTVIAALTPLALAILYTVSVNSSFVPMFAAFFVTMLFAKWCVSLGERMYQPIECSLAKTQRKTEELVASFANGVSPYRNQLATINVIYNNSELGRKFKKEDFVHYLSENKSTLLQINFQSIALGDLRSIDQMLRGYQLGRAVAELEAFTNRGRVE